MSEKPRRRLPFLIHGIRARLFLLIALTLLPLLLLHGLIQFERYQIRKAHAIQTELEVAQGIAATYAAYFNDIRHMNGAVGEAILTFDVYTQEKTTRLLTYNQERYRSVRSLSWATPDGSVIASSDPAMAGHNLADRLYFREVLAGRQWAVGELTPEGKATDTPTFGIAVPIFEEGTLQGVVVAGIEPAALDEPTAMLRRPEGGAFAIFDLQGNLVYHTREPPLSWEERVRWKESDPLLRRALETGAPQSGRVALEIPGGEWFSARAPISGTGWVAGAGRPVQSALAPVRGRLLRDSALAALIASAAFVLAWAVSRTISTPLQDLESDARGMGAGRFTRRDDPTAPLEVQSLRKTVETMAAGLLSRSEELHKSEVKYRAIFEQAAIGIGRVSFTDARWIDANDAFCRMLGYSPEEMRATPWPEITHPDDLDLDLIPFRRMAAGELDSYSVEKRFIHKEGRHVWVQLTLSLVRDAKGRPDYEVAIIEDITGRKKTEEDLRRLTQELERRVAERTAALTAANRELEAFTYTVSHDLRAPLRHIAGFVELLEASSGPALDNEGRRYIRIVSDAARQMSHLIDDLLTFSRIGRVAVTPVPVSLERLVQESRRELAPESEGRSVEWKIGPLPHIHGDPLLLRTVMTNLLSNALKYTRRRDPAIIEVGCREEGDEIVCSVRDNGAGFEMRYADKLFGVFQRLHSSEEFEGTGIGLASVRRIIERHGGRVWAEGETGRGASFHFSLPKSAPEVSEE